MLNIRYIAMFNVINKQTNPIQNIYAITWNIRDKITTTIPNMCQTNPFFVNC